MVISLHTNAENAMSTVSLTEAQANLPTLIAGLAPGEELAITSENKTVAKFVGKAEQKPRPIPVPGRGKGKIVIVSEDDDHLKDFEEYMP
jgi:antitoxin (DNA-binding transcriptional repressor) of toxin-antitoxin stability system